MANELAQYKDEEPILRDVQSNDRSKGQEATAKSFGAAAELAFKTGETLETEASSSMYLQSAVQAEKYKNLVTAAMKSSPMNAQAIYDKAKEGFDAIKSGAYVNKADRAKLNYHIDRLSDQLDLSSTETQLGVNRRIAATSFFDSVPQVQKLYYDQLRTDPKAAELTREKFVQSIDGMVATNTITLGRAHSLLQSLPHIINAAHQVHDTAGNPDATAIDYHKVHANPLDRGANTSIAGSPTDENTNYLHNSYSDDVSFQNQKEEVDRTGTINPDSFYGLKPHQQSSLYHRMDGHADAQSIIRSQSGYPAVIREQKELKQMPSKNSAQEGKLAAIDNYTNALDEGYFFDLYRQSPQGQTDYNKFQMDNDITRNDKNLDDTQKKEQYDIHERELAQNSIVWGDANQIPRDKVKPFSNEAIKPVQQTFEVGGKPSVAIQALSQYSIPMKMYMANSMSTPLQQFTIQTVALSRARNDDKSEFLAAQNKGMDYSGIAYSKDTDINPNQIKKSDVIADVSTDLNNITDLISRQYDRDTASSLVSGAVMSAVNYIQYQAVANNDPKMDHFDDYRTKAVKLVEDSYNIYSNSYATIPRNQLNLSDDKLDKIVSYLRNGTKERFNINPLTQAAYDTLDAHVTLLPTNEFVVTDANGKILNKVTYTSDLPLQAQHYYDENNKNKKEPFKATKTTMKSILLD